MATTDRQEAIETFRKIVLEALDKAAEEVFFPVTWKQSVSGSTDGDLPRLFRAIDAQVSVLADRFDVTLVDWSAEFLALTQQQLADARNQSSS